MKTKRFVAMLLVTAMMMMMAAPAMADTMDIVDTADGAGSFTILLAALEEAGLTETLKGAGPFTVFAPTDEAFADLLAALDIGAADLLGHPDLGTVLLYHVVSGTVLSTDLSDGMTAATVQGEEITVDLTDGVKINQSTVTAADVMASNGVIHIIDTVLVPEAFVLAVEPDPISMTTPDKSIVETAIGNPDFSILVAALQKAGLVEALSGEGPFTVFAPTNAAFADLLEALGISAEELLAQPDLAQALLYHVVSGKVMSTDLADGMKATTLQGEEITFSLMDGVMVNSSNVVAADLDTTNGVIHVIDSVLVPAGFTLAEIAEEMAVPRTGDPRIWVAGAFLLFGAGAMVFSGLRTAKQRN